MADEPRTSSSPIPDAQSALVEHEEHGVASPEDATAFQVRFMRLLERRTAIYTMGDSTSVPTHVAADLLRSVSFVLGIDPARPEIPARLLAVDLEDEFRRRLADIERKVEVTGELWRQVIATMPPIPNTALHDTLASIGDFPRHYDFRSMAHEIPCSIDYPLCHPVPESLVGVDYINEYLRRLLIEAGFLRHFEVRASTRVLERSSPDYVDLLLNLYEPLATNTLGLAVIGEDPTPLLITDEARTRITEHMAGLGTAARAKAMREAARTVCDALGIADEPAREYLRALVPELMPRIDGGVARGDLRGVFVG